MVGDLGSDLQSIRDLKELLSLPALEVRLSLQPQQSATQTEELPFEEVDVSVDSKMQGLLINSHLLDGTLNRAFCLEVDRSCL